MVHGVKALNAVVKMTTRFNLAAGVVLPAATYRYGLAVAPNDSQFAT